MKKKPDVIHCLGYESISCEGGYAMAVWKYIANDCRNKSTDDQVIKMATLVARNAPVDDRSKLMIQFGLMGRSIDLIEEAFALGLKNFSIPTEDKSRELGYPPILELLRDYREGRWQQKRGFDERRRQIEQQRRELDEEERQLRQGREEKEEEGQCVVCMDADAVSQLPCGHICMCKACGVTQVNKLCPLCRTPY